MSTKIVYEVREEGTDVVIIRTATRERARQEKREWEEVNNTRAHIYQLRYTLTETKRVR